MVIAVGSAILDSACAAKGITPTIILSCTFFFRPVLENRQVCLLVDSEEPLRERFVRVACQRGLSARTRKLPVGDFLWVLLPTGVNPDTVRDMPDQELVYTTSLLYNNIICFVKQIVPKK